MTCTAAIIGQIIFGYFYKPKDHPKHRTIRLLRLIRYLKGTNSSLLGLLINYCMGTTSKFVHSCRQRKEEAMHLPSIKGVDKSDHSIVCAFLHKLAEWNVSEHDIRKLVERKSGGYHTLYCIASLLKTQSIDVSAFLADLGWGCRPQFGPLHWSWFFGIDLPPEEYQWAMDVFPWDLEELRKRDDNHYYTLFWIPRYLPHEWTQELIEEGYRLPFTFSNFLRVGEAHDWKFVPCLQSTMNWTIKNNFADALWCAVEHESLAGWHVVRHKHRRNPITWGSIDDMYRKWLSSWERPAKLSEQVMMWWLKSIRETINIVPLPVSMSQYAAHGAPSHLVFTVGAQSKKCQSHAKRVIEIGTEPNKDCYCNTDITVAWKNQKLEDSQIKKRIHRTSLFL